MPVDRKLNLVVVDDDVAIVRIVERILTQQLSDHFDTVAFTDPRAALDWINEFGCDVLISDLEMPGVGGLELLRAAKGRCADLQTILLTAHSSWQRIAEAMPANSSTVSPLARSAVSSSAMRASSISPRMTASIATDI